MPPKITLYTSPHCPWAHRSQIALHELGLEFETRIVDLSVPRTPEYLAINPRGLVPSLDYDGIILTESGLISQFLVDTHPSHLVKTSSEPGGALQRFQISFFVDTYFTKAHPNIQAAALSSGDDKEAAVTKYTDAIINEIEPLLSNAAPFFGGSNRLTLAEVGIILSFYSLESVSCITTNPDIVMQVQTGSMIIRALAFSKHDVILPKSVLTTLEEKAPNFWKWAHVVIAEKSIISEWDEENLIRHARERVKRATMKGQ